MWKKTRLILMIGCFLGALIIPSVYADDPNYVTYGEVVSAFNASLGCLEIYFHDGAYEAAPLSADPGQINPFGHMWEYDYFDAHLLSLGFYFEVEDYKTAAWLTDETDVEFYLQGPNDLQPVKLDVKQTPLKRVIIEWWGVEPNNGTGWRVRWGVCYHQQELPIGQYQLTTDIYAFGALVWIIPIIFYIV